MSRVSHHSERIVVVGGGFAGLAAAVRLSQAGLPVTVLEASQLGHSASTHNQGWLHSGAWFARQHPDLAVQCYQSLRQTAAFCPECLEPGVNSMIYFTSARETGLSEWLQAWDQIGLPYQMLSHAELLQGLPTVDPDQIHAGARLPDRAFRPDILLGHLAATARNAGAEIRSGACVTSLLMEDRRVCGVSVGTGEEIEAQLVVLATGTSTGQSFSGLYQPRSGQQSDYQLVCLKAHLRAVSPGTGCDPFCVVDANGLNHLPHPGTSVFGINQWDVVSQPDGVIDAARMELLAGHIAQFFPNALGEATTNDWAGTTVQAMHVDQIEPGEAPLPTVIDHAREPGGVENVFSIFPGRATLWAHLAEKVRVAVLERIAPREVAVAVPPWHITQ